MITERWIEHVRPNPMRFTDLVPLPCDHISVVTVIGDLLLVKHAKQPVPKMIGITIIDCNRWRHAARIRWIPTAGQAALTLTEQRQHSQDPQPVNSFPNTTAHRTDFLSRNVQSVVFRTGEYSLEFSECQTFVRRL